MNLDKVQFRKIVDQLKNAKPITTLTLPMRDDIRLSVGGVVVIPGIGYMHPESFKDVAGQEAYDYLLTLPRVVSQYD